MAVANAITRNDEDRQVTTETRQFTADVVVSMIVRIRVYADTELDARRIACRRAGEIASKCEQRYKAIRPEGRPEVRKIDGGTILGPEVRRQRRSRYRDRDAA